MYAYNVMDYLYPDGVTGFFYPYEVMGYFYPCGITDYLYPFLSLDSFLCMLHDSGWRYCNNGGRQHMHWL